MAEDNQVQATVPTWKVVLPYFVVAALIVTIGGASYYFISTDTEGEPSVNTNTETVDVTETNQNTGIEQTVTKEYNATLRAWLSGSTLVAKLETNFVPSTIDCEVSLNSLLRNNLHEKLVLTKMNDYEYIGNRAGATHFHSEFYVTCEAEDSFGSVEVSSNLVKKKLGSSRPVVTVPSPIS